MKLLILGLSCSGKTTISKTLSKSLKIQCYHLDSYYWKSCWVKNPDFDINKIINSQEWIIDGNYYEEEFERRLNESNLIVYLKISLIKRLFRMILRHRRYKKNPELYDAVSNKINLKFIISTIKKHLIIQPKILHYLKQFYFYKLICLRGTKELNLVTNEEDIYKLLNANQS